MTLKKEDVWADLRYALDELEREPSNIGKRLTDAARLDVQSEDEFHKRLLQIGLLSSAYSKARARSNSKTAHEAIEKGLKAILIDSGLSNKKVRSYGHKLDQLLTAFRQHSPVKFKELERCFVSTMQYLYSVTEIQHGTNIVEYFSNHGKSELFVSLRYASIEGDSNTIGGMIHIVYTEIIRALLSLIFEWTPRDINHRIETEIKNAILSECHKDTVWQADEWLNQGPARPRLEELDDLKNNKVLRAALRTCAKECKDNAVQYWARFLRHKLVAARRKT